jgi:hypothetical protein
MTNAPQTWKADHLRVSLFAEKIFQESVENFYRLITGADPAEITQKPATGESNATGGYEGLKLEVRRAFNRVDVILQPSMPSALGASLIEDVESSINFIKKLTLNCIIDRDDIIRIALGGNFLYEVGSPVLGYQKLAEMTHQKFDHEKHRDVIFQINFPASSSTLPGLSINRLTQWAVPFHKVSSLSDPSVSRTNYYCGCMTDFNTSADNKTAINEQAFRRLLDELSSEMIHFINAGVIL